MNSHDRKLVALFASAHTLVHVFEQSIPALFPILMAHFALSLTFVGNVQFALALAFGVFAVPAGLLATRWGAQRVVQVYLLIAAGGAVLMATATNAATLLAGAIAVGVGIGLYHPAGTSFLSTHVRARSKAMGYHGMGGGFGVSSGPILTVTLAALIGWRFTLVLYACLACGLIYVLRHLPGMMMPPAATEPDTPAGAGDVPANAGDTDHRRLRVLFVAGTLVGFVYRGVLTFLPLYLGLAIAGPDNPERVALLGGVFASGALYVGMGAQWLGGQLGERYSHTLLYAIGHTASVPCLLLLGYAEGYLLVGAAALFAFGHFLAQPLGNVLVAEYTSTAYRPRAFGWYFALAFGLGAFGATVGGRIGQQFDLSVVFLMLAGVAAMAVVASWWLHLFPRVEAARGPQPAESAAR